MVGNRGLILRSASSSPDPHSPSGRDAGRPRWGEPPGTLGLTTHSGEEPLCPPTGHPGRGGGGRSSGAIPGGDPVNRVRGCALSPKRGLVRASPSLRGLSWPLLSLLGARRGASSSHKAPTAAIRPREPAGTVRAPRCEGVALSDGGEAFRALPPPPAPSSLGGQAAGAEPTEAQVYTAPPHPPAARLPFFIEFIGGTPADGIT